MPTAALARSRVPGADEANRLPKPHWRTETAAPAVVHATSSPARADGASLEGSPAAAPRVVLVASGDRPAAASWGQALAQEGIAVRGPLPSVQGNSAANASANNVAGDAAGSEPSLVPHAESDERGAARGAGPALVVLHVADALAPRLAELRAWRAQSPQLLLAVVVRGLRDLDQVLALEMGADDVIDAGLAAPVVAARLRALWRRALAVASHPAHDLEPPRELRFGTLQLRRLEREVRLANAPVPLTEGEFEVLWLLASHAGQALSRREILKRVRGLDDQPLDRSIDSRVYRIRAKLGDRDASPPRIRTVRHQGYAFSPTGW